MYIPQPFSQSTGQRTFAASGIAVNGDDYWATNVTEIRGNEKASQDHVRARLLQKCVVGSVTKI